MQAGGGQPGQPPEDLPALLDCLPPRWPGLLLRKAGQAALFMVLAVGGPALRPPAGGGGAEQTDSPHGRLPACPPCACPAPLALQVAYRSRRSRGRGSAVPTTQQRTPCAA